MSKKKNSTKTETPRDKWIAERRERTADVLVTSRETLDRVEAELRANRADQDRDIAKMRALLDKAQTWVDGGKFPDALNEYARMRALFLAHGDNVRPGQDIADQSTVAEALEALAGVTLDAYPEPEEVYMRIEGVVREALDVACGLTIDAFASLERGKAA